MSTAFDRITDFIRRLYPGEGPIPLHAPRFAGNEKAYLARCIDTTFVSYVGEYVTRFEEMIRGYTRAVYAVATTSGTTALHTALLLAGVKPGSLVITQSLTFVATANAIRHAGADPVLLDCCGTTLGLSPSALEEYLDAHADRDDSGVCIERVSRKPICACVPVHTFGHPLEITRVAEICRSYGIPVVEDAAEALGSWRGTQHAGTFGALGILSFNGNKVVSTGGGGMILTCDETLAARARHLTTTAKVPDPWEFIHDEVGYNYRMPNVNAAVGCAQMEQLDAKLADKRAIADAYARFLGELGIPFVAEPTGTASNYWLNTAMLANRDERDAFLGHCHAQGIGARPAWRLMHRLPMYRGCVGGSLATAEWLEDRIVNLPSSSRV